MGKTHWSVNEILDKALKNSLKDPQYAYIAPNYGQAKRVAWDIFKDYTKCFGDLREVNEAELRIDINLGPERRIRILLLGAENPDSLRGLYLDGVVLDEYASMYPTVWSEIVRPALSDRHGWASFIGTPKGANHFKDMYDVAGKEENQDDWWRTILRASETNIISRREMESIKREYKDNWEMYLQEYECLFSAALVGAYYGKEMNQAREDGRIAKVPYDRGFKVFTAWDLGMDDSTAIWFLQWVGRELRAIDYIEESGQNIEYYAKVISEKNYNYECHYLPHDAAARSLETGSTIQMKLRELGLHRSKVMPKSNPINMLSEVRRLLSLCWFDEVRCAKGIKALENYERRYDTKTKSFSNSPVHNWASHGADAFRTFALEGMRAQQTSVNSGNRELPTKTISEYDIFGR